MLRDKPTSQAMTRCRSARTLSKRSANRTAAPGTEMESAFAAYVIIITDPNPICLPLTCTRIVRLRPKLVSEIASAATASANQPAFRLASTCKDSARVWRSMTMTLIRTAMASAASRLQVLAGHCYRGVRLRLGRGVHPVGQRRRSARVGPGGQGGRHQGQNTPAMLGNPSSLG